MSRIRIDQLSFVSRYIPGDMEFSCAPESSCLSPPDPDKYQPKMFSTTALTQGKVELTWDEEDSSRHNQTRKKIVHPNIELACMADYLDVGDKSRLILNPL